MTSDKAVTSSASIAAERRLIIAQELEDLSGRLFSQKLDPSGSLLYIPFPNWIEIYDTQTGNLRARLALPSQLLDIYDAFAVDESFALRHPRALWSAAACCRFRWTRACSRLEFLHLGSRRSGLVHRGGLLP